MGRRSLSQYHSRTVKKHSDAIARYLVKRGHEVTFVNSEYTGEKAGVQYLTGEYVIRRKHPYHPTNTFLREIIKTQPPYDIINHTGSTGSSWEQWRKTHPDTKWATIPTVSSLWASRTATLSRQSKWMLLLRAKPFRFLASHEEGIAARHANVVTVTSSAVADMVAQEHSIPSTKIHVIPRGTDVQYFSQAVSPIKSPVNGPTLLTVSRLDKEKGIRSLLNAMPMILNAYPNAYLYIVGDGPDEPNLQQIIQDLTLENRVKLVGRVTRDQVRQYYAGCDIFFLCSFFDAFGATIIEAAAAGKPAIVADRGGPKDVVQEGQTGYIVNPKDPESISGACIKLLTDPESRLQMGKAAQKRVFSEYTFEKEAERYETLYQSIIQSRLY